MKIPVKHYIEITDITQLSEAVLCEGEIVNEGGKQYLVEVWS